MTVTLKSKSVMRAVSNEHELGSPQEQNLMPESLCNS